jgi:hypothetical protein
MVDCWRQTLLPGIFAAVAARLAILVDASAALIGSLPEVATSAVSASARGIVGVTHQERGLPAMGSGPENPTEFAYRNVLIFTFFYRADSMVPKIVVYRTHYL